MRILYDQQIFSFQEYGGISRYFYELIKEAKKTKNRVLIDGKFSNSVYLPQLKNGVVKVLPKYNFPYKNLLLFYLNSVFDSNILKSNKYDLLHVTYYHPYFLKKLKAKPYVITVYDMIHELYSKDYNDLNNQTAQYKRKTISNAAKIIAISENTKRDLMKIYKIPEDKITVIYLGNPLESAVPSKVNNLPDKYLLFVGNRQGYKNFTFFVNAVAPILEENEPLFLVCAGGGKLSADEKILLSKLKIKERILQVGFKNDNELAYLYKNALVYVLPSLYEGFGMTALEAFSMGCPVVASNNSSIPEVCGNAAVYIDPENKDSIRIGVEKVMSDRKLKVRLVGLGYAQLKKFSWGKMVKKTLNVYEKALKP